MRKKSRECICLIIAFLMLCSGMCLEAIETDSFLTYNYTESNICYVDTARAVEIKTEECAIENSSTQGFIYVQKGVKRYTHNQGIQRNSLKISRAEEVKLCSEFFTTAGYVQTLNQDRKTVTVNYIHNQDGKK